MFNLYSYHQKVIVSLLTAFNKYPVFPGPHAREQMGSKEDKDCGHDHYLGTDWGRGQITFRAGHSSQRGSNGDSTDIEGPVSEEASGRPQSPPACESGKQDLKRGRSEHHCPGPRESLRPHSNYGLNVSYKISVCIAMDIRKLQALCREGAVCEETFLQERFIVIACQLGRDFDPGLEILSHHNSGNPGS